MQNDIVVLWKIGEEINYIIVLNDIFSQINRFSTLTFMKFIKQVET